MEVKFKVGDRVRITDKAIIEEDTGKVGTVIEVRSSTALFKYRVSLAPNHSDIFTEEDLELVTLFDDVVLNEPSPNADLLPPGRIEYAPPGVSRRDWFAGMALQGLCSGDDSKMNTLMIEADAAKFTVRDLIANMARKQADALIGELDRTAK